jgi:hypothetical protein
MGWVGAMLKRGLQSGSSETQYGAEFGPARFEIHLFSVNYDAPHYLSDEV